MKPIQEKDFDFRKTISQSINYQKINNSFSVGVIVLLFSVLMSLGFLMILDNAQTHKYSKVKDSVDSPISNLLISFKSFTPASFDLIQKSVSDIFSIHSTVNKDKSSVRIGVIDDKLDKVQSSLLKKIQTSSHMKTIFDSDSVEVDSSINHISVLSFDSESKTMVLDVKYNLKLESNNSDTLIKNNPLKIHTHYFQEKEKLVVSLDSKSNISDIHFLK